MIAPPPSADDVEQVRQRVAEETQAIFTEAQRDVNAEIERLDAAKTWAEAEMDRITADALKDLDDGRDPDEVERQLRADLDATIAKASAPGFDPRPPAPPAIVASSPAPITPPPPIAIPPAHVDVPVALESGTAQLSSCACGRHPSRSAAGLAVLALAIVLRGRRGR